MDIHIMLIEEVKNRSILYDTEHSEYRNLKEREREWREIARALNFNEEECKRRWKRLRDSYIRCKRLKKTTTSRESKWPKKQWKYFEALSFLDNVRGTRRNTVSDWRTESPDPLYRTFQTLSPSPQEEKYIKDMSSQSSQCSSASSPREKQKKIGDDFEEFIDLAESNYSENNRPEAAQNQVQDSTATLFAILAAKIRQANMPPYVLNRVEAKVSALVFAELESFYSTTN